MDKGKPFSELKEKLLRDPATKAEYDRIQEEAGKREQGYYWLHSKTPDLERWIVCRVQPPEVLEK